MNAFILVLGFFGYSAQTVGPFATLRDCQTAILQLQKAELRYSSATCVQLQK